MHPRGALEEPSVEIGLGAFVPASFRAVIALGHRTFAMKRAKEKDAKGPNAEVDTPLCTKESSNKKEGQ